MNPVLAFWIAVIGLTIFGVVFLADIIFIMFYWDKLLSFLKQRLKKVPWEIKDVLTVCIGLFFIYAVLNLAGYLMLKFYIVEKKQIVHFFNIFSTVSMYGVGTWFMLRFISIRYDSCFSFLGINWYSWIKKSLKSILIYIGCFPFLIILTYIGVFICFVLGIQPEPHPMVDILKNEKSVLFILYLIFTASIIAPIFEEILFRGLFYQVLKKKFGFWPAIVSSSLLFSMLHFNTAQFLPIAGLGMLLCLIFEYTGSLVPVIVLHIFNNALFLGLFFVMKDYIYNIGI
jgi:membrane protease YdiL (CAAX protease family)